MGRLFRFLVILALLGFAGLVGYAYLGPLAPETEVIRQEVTLDAGN